MKKFSIILTLLLALSVMFSFTACAEYENGVRIKYATLTLSFTDDDGEAQSEELEVKLYTNYAPLAVERFVTLCENGFYNNTVANTIETGWISLGGYKMTDGELEQVTSGLGTVKGEFPANGLSGNKLTVAKGSVIMFRDFRTNAQSNYDTADCRFVICTSTSAVFTTQDYCVIGKITDADQLKVLDEIAKLRTQENDDEVEVDNHYYLGGIEEIAASFYEDGVFNQEKADLKGITKEEVDRVMEGGNLYKTKGYMTNDDFNEYFEVARKFISSFGSSEYAYFYNVPWNTVSITATKVTNKI